MLSLTRYPELEDQKQRYLSLGYTKVFCQDMQHLYNYLLDASELKRWVVSGRSEAQRVSTRAV